MRGTIVILSLLLATACKQKETTNPKQVASVEAKTNEQEAVDLEVYDFEGFKAFLNKEDDKTYVINFWATWCAPCVKELPYFEELNANYKDKNLEVILVSLDFPSMYDTKLKPFISAKSLKSKVIALNDPSENKWINQVDSSWSGSIPATIIYNKNERKFFERSFTYETLEQEVKHLK